MVLVISAVGLNYGNLIFTRHLPWVGKIPVAVENNMLFVTVFLRCLTADWLINIELAPESNSALRKIKSFLSCNIFSSMKLSGTNFVCSVV